MQWAIAEYGKLKKTKVRQNLIRVRSLEGLGILGRLGLSNETLIFVLQLCKWYYIIIFLLLILYNIEFIKFRSIYYIYF